VVVEVGIGAAETVLAGALLESLAELLDGFVACAHAF